MIKRLHISFLISLIVLSFSASVMAQIGLDMDVERKPIEVSAFLSQNAIPQGETAQVLVICEVPKDYHLTSLFNELTPPEDSEFTFSEVTPPKGIEEDDEIIFRGDVPFLVNITAPEGVASGSYELTFSMRFQSCQERPQFMCFAPESKTVTLPVDVVDAGAAVEPANAERFNTMQAKLQTETPAAQAPAEAAADDSEETVDLAAIKATTAEPTSQTLEDRVANALESNLFLALLLVFVGGFLTSLTPCVYPMIPITISYIGGRAKGRLHGFYLSLFFVLGIAIMYSALGIFAASTGALFGNALQNPIAITVVAIVFVAMGASMLGAFDIVIPSSLQTKLQSKQKGGVIGAIIMGMVTGIVASPCVGPVLVVLLTWVAKTGSMFLGFWLLFIFAIGMGMLFLVIGTFSGVMSALPQAGGWMESIKHFFGVILIAMAVYYISPLLSESINKILVGLLLIFFGTFVGAFQRLSDEAVAWSQKFYKGLGVASLATGVFYLIIGLMLFNNISFASQPAASGTGAVAQHEGVQWIMSEEQGLEMAREQDKPIMIDFYADWCAACIELDEKTWIVPTVAQASERFVNIKMDFTDTDDPEVKAAQNRYKITGMPTVIFMDSDGEEITRFVGFKNAEEVLKIMGNI